MDDKKKHIISLDEQKTKAPFDVHQDYFEVLPQQIQQRVAYRKKEQVIFNPFIKYGIATAVLVILGITLYPSSSTPDSDAQKMIASLEEQELIAYLDDESISDINPYELEMEEAVDIAIENDISFPDIELISSEEAQSLIDEEYFDLDNEALLEDIDLEDLEF